MDKEHIITAKEACEITNDNNMYFKRVMGLIAKASSNGNCKAKYYIDEDDDCDNYCLTRYLGKSLISLCYTVRYK